MMVLGGVFERHPELKLVVAESDAGWLPHYMYRMDHAAEINAEGGIIKGLSKLPSEYIRTNVWATFQDDLTAYHPIDHFPYEPPAVGQRLPPHRLDVAAVAPADRRAGVAPRRGAAPGDLPRQHRPPVQPPGRRAVLADGGPGRRRTVDRAPRSAHRP